MRGAEQQQTVLFSFLSVEDRIPADHPLRAIQTMVNPILTALSPRFDTLFAATARPSIPPDQLLCALMLQQPSTTRSERQLMEQLDYNQLFRWFVGLNPEEGILVPTVFTKNRDRLVAGNIDDASPHEILRAVAAHGFSSHEHLTVDGTLLEPWARQKILRRKDGTTPPPTDTDPKNPTVNLRD